MKKINLNPKILVNKKFTTELSGYNPTEVDRYLDQIIEDYTSFDENLKMKDEKLKEMKMIINKKNEELEIFKLKIIDLEKQLKDSSQASNYEILKELKEIKRQKK